MTRSEMSNCELDAPPPTSYSHECRHSGTQQEQGRWLWNTHARGCGWVGGRGALRGGGPRNRPIAIDMRNIKLKRFMNVCLRVCWLAGNLIATSRPLKTPTKRVCWEMEGIRKSER